MAGFLVRWANRFCKTRETVLQGGAVSDRQGPFPVSKILHIFNNQGELGYGDYSKLCH